MEIDGGQANGRCRISSNGFSYKLNLFGHRSQGAQYETVCPVLCPQSSQSRYFRRNKTFDSLEGLPEEGVFSYNLEHLLGIPLPTQGPEADTGTPGRITAYTSWIDEVIGSLSELGQRVIHLQPSYESSLFILLPFVKPKMRRRAKVMPIKSRKTSVGEASRQGRKDW